MYKSWFKKTLALKNDEDTEPMPATRLKRTSSSRDIRNSPANSRKDRSSTSLLLNP